MNKLLLIASIIVGASFAARAQQVPWGQMKLKSPELNTDTTITFRLEAPNAQSVALQGDFTGGNAVAMTKDENGVWSTTLDRLPSDLYGYHFLVDGLEILDPNNVYVMRDNTLANILLAPGDRAGLLATTDVPHGTVSTAWYHSPTLGMNRRLTIYLPAEYNQNPHKHYPVLYLLHGLGGDEVAWAERGRMPQILDNMIAAGEAEPMIVVLPNGNSPQQAAPGFNSDGLFVQPTSKLPFVSGAFEASFPEIVEFMDANYRTRQEKSGRAIAGLSMGGMHSRAISLNYPDLFDYVALFSAAINPMYKQLTPIYQDVEAKLTKQFVNAPKLYWIGIGNKDFLLKDNNANRQLMDNLGLPYTYHESEGGHTWTNWRDYLAIILPQLFKQ